MIHLTLCTGHLRQFASLSPLMQLNLRPSLFVGKVALQLLFDFSATGHKVVIH